MKTSLVEAVCGAGNPQRYGQSLTYQPSWRGNARAIEKRLKGRVTLCMTLTLQARDARPYDARRYNAAAAAENQAVHEARLAGAS